MRVARWLSMVVLVGILAGCGPVVSLLAKGTEGVQEVKVVSGDLATLRQERNILVFGPFAKTAEAYYIAKGEDAFQFAESLERAGLGPAELLIEHDYMHLAQTADQLRSKTARQLKTDYHLLREPATILFGTILQRGPVTVYPFRAVIPVTYRLEFYQVAAKTSIVVEVIAKTRYEEIVPAIVAELKDRSGGR